MKNTVIAILFIALVIAVVNDAAHYAKAAYDLDRITNGTIATIKPDDSRDNNAQRAAGYSTTEGATLYLYDQDETAASVWVEMSVPGTWVLAPYMAAVGGVPLNTPYLVRDEATKAFRR